MKRVIYGPVLALVAFVGCRSENGAGLQIQSSPIYSDDCTLEAAPTTFQSFGLFDPAGTPTYNLPLSMQNLLNDTDNPAAIPGDPNVRPSANDVRLVGFDACYYLVDDEVSAYSSDGKGLVRECDDVPSNQRAFVPSSGTVTSGGGLLSVTALVFDLAAQRAIFGDGFDPATLRGLPFDDASNVATRNPAWGDFPASDSATIVIQVRARGLTQNGSNIRSNWFPFPLVVAPQQLIYACSTATVTCPDGTAGVRGGTFPADACAGNIIFSGGPLTCTPVDTCG